jgi:Mu-like prophage major head subunit gpT
MAMNRAQFGRLLRDDLNTVWGLEFKRYSEEWKALYKTEKAEHAFEEDQLVTGFGAASVKAEGAQIAFDEAMQGWTSRYDIETIALGFRITQEMIEDNRYMTMGSKYTQALVRSMIHTKEIKGAAILNNAFNAAFPGGDGVSLISNAHPLVGGGTFSNTLQTAADIAEASLEELLINIRKVKDDRGIPIALKPTDLVIPPDSEFTAVRLLESTLRPGLQAGATAALNDVNAINRKSIFGKEPIVITRMTDTDAFFIKTDCQRGLMHMDRIAINTKMEEDFNTTDYKYRARERYVFGWTDPRGIFGSPGI